MKKLFGSNKFKHGSVATIFIVLFLAVIIGLNVVVSILTERYPSMDMDLTPTKMNTLSDTASETATAATMETEIILVGTEEEYINNMLFSSSYNIEYSQVASIAFKMQEANYDKISVRYADPDLEPTLISEYASDGLSTGMVLVRTDARYKILTVEDMFAVSQDQNTGMIHTFSMVDGALANAVHIVNLDFVPVVAVATGHEEGLPAESRAAFDQLLTDNGFEVVEFNLLTEPIPDDARVLMIPAPNTDYANDEIVKIEEFLDDRYTDKLLLVAANPTQADTPNIDALLADWGLKLGEGAVTETDTQNYFMYPDLVFVNENEDFFVENDFSNLVAVSSSPIEFLFEANNDIATQALLESSSTSYLATSTAAAENPETASYVTSALAYRYNNIEGDNTQTSVMLVGDAMSLLNDFIGTSAFENRDYMITMLRYATKVSDGNLGIYVESVETNVVDIITTMATIQMVGFNIFTIAVPVIILVLGLVVFLRRRHL